MLDIPSPEGELLYHYYNVGIAYPLFKDLFPAII